MAADLIVLDFDGTLVDCDPIGHLMGDWERFHEATFMCPPRLQMLELARRLQTVARVVVVTGKGEKWRPQTVKWLHGFALYPDDILMRPDHSSMPDAELKPALLFDWAGPEWKRQVICAIEDRDKMVDAWRAEGVLCLQAAPCLETKLRKESNNGK